MTTMSKEAFMIAIIDYRINELKDEIRKHIMESEITEYEAICLLNGAYNDISDAVCRLYDVAEE